MRARPRVVRDDRTPLRREAQEAISDLLDAIEHSSPRVRRAVTVECRRGRVYVTTGDGWRIRVAAAGLVIALSVVQAPQGQSARRRAIESEPTVHRYESEQWWARLLDILISREPAWLTLTQDHHQQHQKRAA